MRDNLNSAAAVIAATFTGKNIPVNFTAGYVGAAVEGTVDKTFIMSDCHTAMLLGAARILSEHKAELKGTVKLIFQMAEEIGRKSEEYVKRGALEGVDAIFGMHVWSAMDLGSASFESGERMGGRQVPRLRPRGL